MELLERESFLDAFEEYADAAAAGSGRLVLLSGDPGIGKTTLVDAFRARRPDLTWLWGACDASFTPRPLGPLHDIATEVGGRLRELLGAGADRNELFGAFQDVLTAPGPTAVVVEDLHWADEATLDWLTHVARRIGRSNGLVVVTYRPAEMASDPLLIALGSLAAQGATRRMVLPPLSEAAVGRIAERHGLDADHVYDVTAGNPFYVAEIVADPTAPVPSSVSAVVRARVLRHSPAGRRLLAAAAVVARPATAPLLAALAGVEASVAEECRGSGTLVAHGSRYEFAHELTRLAVMHDLPAYDVAGLHRDALALLLREGADQAELAHHAEGAGDAAATYEHARAAAEQAVRLHSHREAIAQYERCLRSAELLTVPPAAVADLLDALAAMHAVVDQWEEAAAQNERALQLRRQLGEPAPLSATLRHRYTCMWRLCHAAEAAAAADEAWALMAAEPDSLERAWAQGLHARAHLDAPDPAAPRAAIQEALTTAERLGDAELAAWLLQAAAFLRLRLGEDPLPELRQAHEVAVAGGADEQAARALVNLYEMSVDRLLLDETDWVWDTGLQWLEDHEMQTYTHCLAATRSQSLLRRGRLVESVDLAERTLATPMSAVNRAHLHIPYLTSKVRRGDPGVHEELLAARRLAVESGEACWLLPIEKALCELAWLTGDPAIVDDHVLESYAVTAGDEPWLRADLAAALARLGLLADPPANPPSPYREEIRGDHRAAAAVWREHGCPYEAAVALTTSGEPDLLEEALAAFVDLGADPAAARVRRTLRGLGKRAVPRGPRRSTRAHPAGLTAREAEVLAHLVEGLTNAQIADRLVLSPRTVDHHVSAVLAKLGVATRAAAARRAAELGADLAAGQTSAT